MLVEELFIILWDISDLYGMRYFNYDLYVFQFEQTFRHFRAPATEPGPGAAYSLTPPFIGPAWYVDLSLLQLSTVTNTEWRTVLRDMHFFKHMYVCFFCMGINFVELLRFPV